MLSAFLVNVYCLLREPGSRLRVQSRPHGPHS